ncbi:MAG: ABC transporter permease [Cypionkella sp.]|nr:ABC transporter permease [Cypionkella sp.]
MNDLIRRYGTSITALMCLLVAFWLVMLVIVPNITLFEQSFRPYLPVIDIGGPKGFLQSGQLCQSVRRHRSTQALLGIPINIPVHVMTFGLTIWYSIVVTVACFVLAYPLAFFMAKIANPKSLPTLLLLLFIPLWVSEVLRAFAWWIILALKGPLNALLLAIGAIEKPVRWIVDYDGVVIGLTYTYVLFMLFPIYNAIASLDTNQIEAADDLGAPWWKIHLRIVLPHAKPGIASGAVMVFMLSAGSLLVPSILGSTTSQWFTQTIDQWFKDALDWNTASAYAFILLLLCTVFVSIALKVFNVKLSDIAK